MREGDRDFTRNQSEGKGNRTQNEGLQTPTQFSGSDPGREHRGILAWCSSCSLSYQSSNVKNEKEKKKLDIVGNTFNE